MSAPVEGTWVERATDSLIGMVSPKRAVLRRFWRAIDRDPNGKQVLGALMRQVGGRRGYSAAQTKGSDTPWDDSHASADAELSPALDTLRNRSRAANRDDAVAAGLSLTRELNVVGPELIPQARTGDADKNEALEAVWKDNKDRLDPINRVSAGTGQRLRLRKLDEDGELFVARVVDGDRLHFELIESDRVAIDYPLGSTPAGIPEGNYVIDGIEKDPTGRPVAYWVWDYAPGAYQRGQIGGGRAGRGGIGSANRVRRYTTDQCRHVKHTLRPGQSRGVPANHATLRDMHDLDLLMLASLKRCQIAACLAAFIQSSEASTDLFELTAEKYGYKLEQDIEPGMIFKLFPGETVTSFTPSFPFPEIEPLIVMVARRIGAARGVSWQTVLNDWSQSNYSSARTQLLEDRQSYTVSRKQLCDELLTWEWVQVMEWALLAGDTRLTRAGVTLEDVRSVEWIAFGWQWVDPEKEAKAVEISLAIGLTTLRDEAAKQGKDWEDLQDQALRERLRAEAREAELRKEMGLPEREVEEPDEDDDDETEVRLRALEISRQSTTVVNMPESRYSICPPEQPAPIVNVEARAEAPVNVVASPVTVENVVRAPDVHNYVNVEVEPTPIENKVNVKPAPVRIANVPIESPPKRITFTKDGSGKINGAAILSTQE